MRIIVNVAQYYPHKFFMRARYDTIRNKRDIEIKRRGKWNNLFTRKLTL